MAPNSLFAILLRSPWWISFVVVIVITLAAAALLPGQYAAFGAVGTLPFFVIGCMAAWRQWRAPSPAKVEQALQRAQAQPWRQVAQNLQAAWTAQGFDVQMLTQGPADFALRKKGQTVLVSARRWKAVTHGTEPLRELAAAIAKEGAQSGLYVAAGGALSENAAIFARDHHFEVMDRDTLGALLLRVPGA